MEPNYYRANSPVNCPKCGKTSEVDQEDDPRVCPACKYELPPEIRCTQCRHCFPYQGNMQDIKVCPKCGADPVQQLRATWRWEKRYEYFAAMAAIAVIAMLLYTLYLRFFA